jgi:hypothetical protein
VARGGNKYSFVEVFTKYLNKVIQLVLRVFIYRNSYYSHEVV